MVFHQISMSAVDNRLLNTQVRSSVPMQSSGSVTNSQSSTVQEWHKQINAELREHLVKKL